MEGGGACCPSSLSSSSSCSNQTRQQLLEMFKPKINYVNKVLKSYMFVLLYLLQACTEANSEDIGQRWRERESVVKQFSLYN